ncbi:MAG: TatD family hydrolase [Candidatus Aenigmatarchaeota archaeon]
MIDYHCHLSVKEFKGKENPLRNRIEEYRKHLKLIIDSVASIEDFERAISLKEKYPDFVYISAGLHPIDSLEVKEKELENYMEKIKENRDKIIAIGEIGLDFYWIKENNKIEKSKEVFVEMLNFAKELKLPIVLHARNAIKEVLKIIIDNDIKNAVFHYYDGKVKLAKEIIKEGYFIGINSYIAKNNAIKAVAKEIPLEFLLSETDSPWCAINSEFNEPINVKIVIEEISKLKNLSFEKVESIIDENTLKFFNLI